MNQEKPIFLKKIAALTEISLLPTNNLKEIKIDSDDLEKLRGLTLPVIFVTTHLSDWDSTAFINALAKQTDIEISIAHDSSHDNFFQNSFAWLQFSIAKIMVGKENFLPITYRHGKGVFLPQDYESQTKVIEEGRSVVMAGYHSRKNDKEKGIKHIGYNQHGATLPLRGGVGAVFLSILSGAPLVPVAVNVESDTLIDSFVGRPSISIKIGEPISPKIESDFHNWETMTKEEKRLAIKELRHYSDMILRSQAEMLPAEKRGR